MNKPLLSDYINANKGRVIKEIKNNLYEEALTMTGGNVSEAARLLGVSRSGMSNYKNDWSTEK